VSLVVRQEAGGLAAAEAWWDVVMQASVRPSPFASHAWLSTWWATYGGDRRLHLLRLEEQGKVLGGIALYVCTRRVGGVLPVRELRLVGDRHVGSEGLDLLVPPGREAEAVAALDDHLAGALGASWDMSLLGGLRPGAALLGAGAAGWTEDVNRCPYLLIEPGARIAPIGKNLAARVARKSRAMFDREGFRFARCESEVEIPLLLDALFHCHQERWEARGEPGAFASSPKREFYRAVAPRLLRAGMLELFGIWEGDRPRAVLFGASAGSTLYYLQSGFDAGIASFGPGNVLLFQILQDAQRRGFRRFDFMKGDEAYKFQWTRDEEPLRVRREPGRSWRARLASTALRCAEDLGVRRSLRPGVTRKATA